MTIQLTSTTDSAEDVQAVMGLSPEAKKAEEEAQSAPADKVEPEQKPASDSETEDDEEAGEAKDETEDESEESEESKGENEGKPRKKRGFQKRIDKLNARYAAAQAEAEHWKQQALKGAGDSKASDPIETPNRAAQDGKPDAEDFETHAEYVEALTDWKTEQKFKEREQAAEKSKLMSEQERLLKSHVERVQAFASKHDDFQEALESVDDVPVSPAVQEIILSSENGPELMYELAKNREEYERINKLSPLAAAREIGRIESRLAKASEKPKPEPQKTTKAPPPISPIGASGGPAQKNPEEMSYQDYKKWREAELSRR